MENLDKRETFPMDMNQQWQVDTSGLELAAQVNYDVETLKGHARAAHYDWYRSLVSAEQAGESQPVNYPMVREHARHADNLLSAVEISNSQKEAEGKPAFWRRVFGSMFRSA